MVVFGQRWLSSDKGISIRSKWLYSGKICCITEYDYIRAKWLYFCKVCCIRPKMVVFVQNGFILAKVVVFGQSGCIRTKWLY